ncbi:MAG: AbrB/MazE/SpoVT family DNA-binding domain-containing protein [Candidatus Hermodarchaeota archaeon]
MKWERTNRIISLLEDSIKTTIDERGRIYIPQKIRKKLSIECGTQIFLIVQEDHILVYTPLTVAKIIQKDAS